MTTPPDDGASTGFSSLGLADKLVSAVNALGYEEPTPIQREAIPLLREGRDLIGLAGTGTGKTAAFALPLLDRLVRDGARKHPGARALILVPTRELAMQASEALHKYAQGSPPDDRPALRRRADGRPDARVAPRRRRRRRARPGACSTICGARPSTSRTSRCSCSTKPTRCSTWASPTTSTPSSAQTPETRQTALFAATMAPRIVSIAGKHLKSPSRVHIAHEKRPPGKLPQVRQAAYIVGRAQKMTALGRILDFENPKSAIVFCRTRLEVDELTDTLNAHGYGAQALHGGMVQKQRDRVMQLFRNEKADILVATDVAARGLDIDHVSHVINFDLPTAPEVYVHRIGRTGRIGREGVAITLANPREQRFLRSVEGSPSRRSRSWRCRPRPTCATPARGDADAMREQLTAGELDEARAIVDALAQEFDMIDIAAAAVKMVHLASEPTMPEASVDIPQPSFSESRPERGDRRGSDGDQGRGARPRGRASSHDGPMAVIFIGAGKSAGIRPGDLVGAITGEAGVPSSVLGGIRISEGYSLVEVPEDLAASIMTALKATKIRGQKVTVRRDRDKG